MAPRGISQTPKDSSLKVIIGCEFSGIVRDAFRARGHDAWSCDISPCEADPAYHIQGDVLAVLDQGWDLGIFHPPCTYLCVSGLHWNKRRPGRSEETEKSLIFVGKLLDAPIPKVGLENPVGCISTRIRKPSQIIQPYEYGHPESKKTCLWLRGLPPLVPTNIVYPPPAWIPCPEECGNFWCTLHLSHAHDCKCPEITDWKVDPYTTGGRWSNQTPSGQNKLGPSETRSNDRARTYPGIGKAMAEQWG